jgi:imidazolonepropionase-like amidohydrolase
MNRAIRLSAAAMAAAAALGVAASADAPHVYAIKGARLVTAAGAPIPSGTLVMRNGLIADVGPAVQAPAGAVVIDGTGLTVYPGLVDMGNASGIEAPAPAPPANLRTTEEAERWKRSVIFRPDLDVTGQLRADSPDLARLANAGITSVLATPTNGVVKGQSALVNVVGPVDEPQIGNVGDYRAGLQVVRAPVALHVEFATAGGRGGYPVSLLGVISFVRQSFLDAQYQQAAEQRYARLKGNNATRPPHDPSLQALQPALEGRLPVAFEADAAREIRRALAIAAEFKLDPVISGGREADQVATELKSRNAEVIYNLNYPTRPRTLAPDADEAIDTLRARAQAPKVPAALEKAGVLFAFSSAGLREPRDFVRNAARAVREGLPPEAAVRALTINAARIAGAADRVGSLEKGKIANVLVTEGDLFDERPRIKHVFVDGRMLVVEEAPQAPQRGRGGQ